MNSSHQSKPPRKNITEAVGVLLPGGGIKYATDRDKEIISGVPVGTPIRMTPVKNNRFLKHHQKFWKLLELGFMYWIPDWAFVSDPESWIAHEVAKEVAVKAGTPDMYDSITKDIAELVLSRVANQRKERFDAQTVKTMEAYFNHVMCKACFFDLTASPDGGTLKQRWSIAFANMSQEKFNGVYRGVAGVIWNETLSQYFNSRQDMDQAIDRLMEYM